MKLYSLNDAVFKKIFSNNIRILSMHYQLFPLYLKTLELSTLNRAFLKRVSLFLVSD